MPIKNNKNAEQLWGKDIDTPSSSDDNKVMVYNADTDSYEYSNQFADYHSLTQELSYTVDEERKFWKDDFSVDTSENYTGDVASFTWDTANKRVKIVAESSNPIYARSLNFYGYREFTHWSSDSSELTCGYLYLFPTDTINSTNYIRIYPFPDTGTGYSSIRCDIKIHGIDVYSKIVSSNGMLKTDPHKFGIELLSNAVKFYVDGVLISTYNGTSHLSLFTEGVIYNSIQLVNNTTTKTAELYATDLVDAPSESYADDFTTDTVSGANGRYQAVTGTVAYDTDHMNVVTASGVNGKASGRLKSYKFCEGSQIFDVTLPTGADGDLITLVTHSANGLMTDGIGVGLQSDGAGNWNLATLSGTTVTEGADSGLVDGKTARIEIEKDVTGAYWYYIYNASGTKPTTATGKLFTTLTEGYTGWYANGAGATTQTYTIDNISIRAESIVGRTNVELTEEVFNSVTGEMETRTYFKPIHRGAMLETYHDGTQEVVGTTFVDDCQWDRSGEWTGDIASFTRNTTNGRITIAASKKQITSNAGKFGEGIYAFDYHPEAADTKTGFIICSQSQDSGSMTNGNKYIVYLNSATGINVFKYVGDVQTNFVYTAYPFTNGTTYRFVVTWFAGVFKIYVNDILTTTSQIGTTFNEGYFGFGTNSTGQISISNIAVIAASSDATNGIAACIPPIGGGARYDTQESITQTIDMSGIVSSDLKAYSSAISTNAAETALLRITAKNDTDDTSVYSDGTTKYWDVVMDGTVINTRKALETNFNDMGDSVVFTHSTDAGVPDGCIYVRETICKPITIVMEEDLT